VSCEKGGSLGLESEFVFSSGESLFKLQMFMLHCV